jgi:hypothetical protein
METMYYIGLDVHKKTISYCVKDGSGRIYAEGSFAGALLRAQVSSLSFPFLSFPFLSFLFTNLWSSEFWHRGAIRGYLAS